MPTRKLQLFSVFVDSDHIYGLDGDGAVWYRKKIPSHFSSYNTAYTNTNNKTDAKKEEEILWKPVAMDARVALGDNGPPIEVPAHEGGEALEVPVAPIEVDAEMVVADTAATPPPPPQPETKTEDKDEPENYCC